MDKPLSLPRPSLFDHLLLVAHIALVCVAGSIAASPGITDPKLWALLAALVLAPLAAIWLAYRIRIRFMESRPAPRRRAFAASGGATLAAVLLVEGGLALSAVVSLVAPYGALDLPRRAMGYQGRLELDFRPSWIVYSPDGRLLITGADNRLVLRPAAGEGPALRFDTGGAGVSRVLPSPDGQIIAALLADDTLRLWRASDGAPLRSIPLEGVSRLAFSRDSSLLAAAGYAQPARVWRVADWELLQTVPHQPALDFLGFALDNTLIVSTTPPSPDERSVRALSPDGRLAAQADWDGSIRLEDRATGEVLRTLTGSADTITSLNFSPDSALLVSANLKANILRVWRVADGRQIALYGLAHGGDRLALAPDNRTLAVLEGWSVLLWRVPEQR